MTKRAYYTKELGKKVASSARPDKITKIHVIWDSEKSWSVVAEGKTISIRTALEKKEALAVAKKSAKSNDADLVIVHDKNGNIAERIKVS